ncbi:MAG: ribosomal protein S18-alanine N-acetyltransferase [Anaerolineae bacterium]
MASGEAAYPILPATWRDLWAVRRLERAVFGPDAYPWYEILGLLTFPGVVNLKAVDDANRLVGYIAGDPRPTERLSWIVTIAVYPTHQRRGIGRRLLRACEAALPPFDLRLTVRDSNTGAIRLYEQCGYRVLSRWPGYYRDGEDGLVMAKAAGQERAPVSMTGARQGGMGS